MATGILNLPYPMSPVSPFDVITSQAENERIANIESLADGTGIGDKAITSDKLDFTTLNFGNYSTSEVDTGFKWIDGKAIYKKTISIGALPNASAKNVAHGISGLDRIINMYGVAKAGTVEIPLPLATANGTNQVQINRNTANIDVACGGDRSTYSGYVTLFYTKA